MAVTVAAFVVSVVALTPAVAVAAATPSEPAGAVSGSVAGQDGSPTRGVTVEVFRAPPTGGKGPRFGSTRTNRAGNYLLAVPDGCYVVELTAPAAERFVGVGSVRRQTVCVEHGRAERKLDAVIATIAASASGHVHDLGGRPVAMVAVDLFDVAETGGSARYLSSASTDQQGRYDIAVPRPGCYRLRLTASDGVAFSPGGRHVLDLTFCAEADDEVTGLDAEVAAATRTSVAGRAVDVGTAAVVEVAVGLQVMTGDGTTGSLIAESDTGPSGWFELDVEPGCYVADLEAPEGRGFVAGGRRERRAGCVAHNDRLELVDGVLSGNDDRAPAALSATEWEIVRLSNELRAHPGGPLARQGPLPECVADPYYAITLDPTGLRPEPTEPLAVDLGTSAALARTWAAELPGMRGLNHRSDPSQIEIYDRLGLDVDSWGENIAWASDVGSGQLARFHFESLRESTAGHYCALVTGRFTHIGIGELSIGDESWLVQNFYRVGA